MPKAKQRPAGKDGRADYHHGNLREALVASAVKIIAEESLAALTLRKVAAAAQVSRTAPYRHFENKEALLAAVAEEGFRTLARRMADVAVGASDSLEKIIRQGVEYVLFARRRPAHFQVMFGFSPESLFTHSSLAEVASGAFMVLLDSMSDCQEAGIVRKGNTGEIAFGAWTLAHGLATLMISGLVPFDTDNDEALEKLVRENALRYLEGVKEKERTI